MGKHGVLIPAVIGMFLGVLIGLQIDLASSLPQPTPSIQPICGWQKGPVPENTWQWGGVVIKGESELGFYFADFCGDHVAVQRESKPGREIAGKPGWSRYGPNEIVWWNNALSLPIKGAKEVKGRN